MPMLKVVTPTRLGRLPSLVAEKKLLDTVSVLVIPGWNGSGHGHWQTIWEHEHPRFRRVEQRSWVRPSRQDWVEQIDADVRKVKRPLFLVAHSLGCLAVAHWAAAALSGAKQIAGAFLVAPPWLTLGQQCPEELADFLPMPTRRLPFASMLVASENDPYIPIQMASRLATAWGSQLVDVGRQGHINIASGHGTWPVGEDLLRGFVGNYLDGEDSPHG
jgi:predicted alpha/beta hydrolase family esterase